MRGEDVARQEATQIRKALHASVASCDLQGMRKALHELYTDEQSPLEELGGSTRTDAFAPIVETALLASVYAPNTTVFKEAMLNMRHTYASFGVTSHDYEKIKLQISTCDQENMHDIDWCVDTCLHGRVKPLRHAKLFQGVVKHQS